MDTSSPNRREVVVITGASAGVGRATVRAFARRGARIGLVARGMDGLLAAKREAEDLGGEAIVLPVDVADPGRVKWAADQVEKVYGPIDVWVNNAMTSVFSPFMEIPPDEFRRVTEVTYLGYVHGTLAALRRMVPRDRGTIVQVGSALSFRSIPLQSAYCGAKHAIRGFTDSVRCELIHMDSRVHVTMVQLPALNTPQFRLSRSRMPRRAQPVPPIFQPEVAAEAIVWAAHNRKREMHVGWPTVKAAWAQKFVPALADRRLGRDAWDAQMTAEPAVPELPDNLWEPVPGDHGAHGVFDGRAATWAVRMPLAGTDRREIGITLLAAGVALAVYLESRLGGRGRRTGTGKGSTARRSAA